MTLNQLKGFFQKNMTPKEVKTNESQSEEKTQIEFGKTDQQTYEDWGFDMSKKQRGNERAFIGCWVLVREYYSKKERNNMQRQEEEIKKAQNELDRLDVAVQQKNKLIENIKTKIEHIRSKIDELRKDIYRIKENPSSVLKENASTASFIIGLVILLGLTIYLFIFYISAAYSALYHQYDASNIGDSITQSIFQGGALRLAYEKEGWDAALLICTIPFAFLGLGFLIHKFQELKDNSKYLKIGLLIAITLAFDVLMAEHIVKKIYELKRNMEIEHPMPPFEWSMLLSNGDFWIIIFAGFVVYLIWGFVFDFTMESYGKLNVVTQTIKSKESEIKLLENDIQTNQQEIQKVQEDIHNLELEMVPHRKVANGDVVVLNWSRFYQCVNEFTNGWTEWMTANRFEKNHIDEIHLINENLSQDHKGNIAKS